MFSSSVDLLQASVLRPENIHTLNNHNAVDTQLGWWQEIIIKKKKKTIMKCIEVIYHENLIYT